MKKCNLKINKYTKNRGISKILNLKKSDIKTIAFAVFKSVGFYENAEITFVLCNDKFIQKYNFEYRNKDKPTNVLSFPSDDFLRKTGYLGDVLISLETIKKEAIEQKKTVIDHVKHMIVHSILHLLGHDHEKRKDRIKMESIEIEVLSKFGIKNPYII